MFNYHSRRSFLKAAAASTAMLSAAGIGADESVVAKEEQTDSVEKVSRWKIATFKVDVTPPIGEPLAYVPNEKVDAPIYVSGIILDDGKTRVAWVSCDYIYICGETYLAWVDAIARTAKTTRENVFLHAVHQHDSIRLAPEYNPKEGEDGPVVVTPEYCKKSLGDVTAAIEKAVGGTWQTVGKLLTGETRVGGLAANRRLTDENGKFAHTRFSGKNTP